MIDLLLAVGRDFQWTTVLIALAIAFGFSLVLGVLILVINKFTQVKEDPRIKEVQDCLAGANCGACGYPGCAGFAKALVEGTAKLDSCGQTPIDKRIEILLLFFG